MWSSYYQVHDGMKLVLRRFNALMFCFCVDFVRTNLMRYDMTSNETTIQQKHITRCKQVHFTARYSTILKNIRQRENKWHSLYSKKDKTNVCLYSVEKCWYDWNYLLLRLKILLMAIFFLHIFSLTEYICWFERQIHSALL